MRPISLLFVALLWAERLAAQVPESPEPSDTISPADTTTLADTTPT
jgi:hypothetical protein